MIPQPVAASLRLGPALAIALAAGCGTLAGSGDAGGDLVNPPAAGFDLAGSDARAVRVADATVTAMGGRRAWDRTRYVAWDFFGRRRHVWDKKTGNVRIEGTSPESGEPYVILMNLQTGKGRAWRGGLAVADPGELEQMLDAGEGAWINDSYWLVMPYKLMDAGVTLSYLGERETEAGRPADVLQLTFADVGRTPQNKYHVYVAKASGLVEQWAYFADRQDDTPRIKVPWGQWKRYGRIMLSGDRGEVRGNPARLTDIAVFDELPESILTSPEPVDWPPRRPKQAAFNAVDGG
jgi:hypothetical protein